MPWNDYPLREIIVLGPNNTSIDINPTSGDVVIYFNPDTVGPPAATDVPVVPGVVYVFTSDFAQQIYSMILASPNPPSGSPAQVILTSSDKAGALQPTVELSGTVSDLNDTLVYPHGQSGVTNIAMVAVAGANFPVVFPVAFPVGVTPVVICNLDTGAGVAAPFYAKAMTPTNTGFTIRVQTSGAAATFNSTVSWVALIPF